jgi:hypothetical protein
VQERIFLRSSVPRRWPGRQVPENLGAYPQYLEIFSC